MISFSSVSVKDFFVGELVKISEISSVNQPEITMPWHNVVIKSLQSRQRDENLKLIHPKQQCTVVGSWIIGSPNSVSGTGLGIPIGG